MRGQSLVACCLAAIGATACASAPAKPLSKQNEWVDLFDTGDLSRWSPFSEGAPHESAGTWSFDRGSGVLSGTGLPKGYLCTKAAYRHYAMRFEWRFPQEGNSGVLLRKVGVDRVWPKSIEAQVKTGASGNILPIEGFPIETPSERIDPKNPRRRLLARVTENPVGEWSRYEIILEGDRLALIVNGQLVNEGWGLDDIPGQVCFQAEGSSVQFRNVVIKTLPDSQPNRLSAVEARTGWRLLFDGASTAGWRGYKQAAMPSGWRIRDGALTRVGPGGDVVTVDEFESFELSLEWKMTAGANSGVMYKVTEQSDKPWKTGIEYQLADNTTSKSQARPKGRAGACYGLFPPAKDNVRPLGDWNLTRIVVKGARVEHWLNGATMVAYRLDDEFFFNQLRQSKFATYPGFARATRGHIALQDHNGEVAFRNIKIRSLPR